MSIDGYGAFQEIGMDNDAAIAQEGLRYRDTILSMGGARAPALVFQVRETPACIIYCDGPSMHREAQLHSAGCAYSLKFS